MKNLLKTAMMPLAVVVLGVAGAFATMSMGSSKTVLDQQGYRFVSSTDQCHIAKMCATTGGTICKYSPTVTAWGKADEELDHPCNVQLFEKQ